MGRDASLTYPMAVYAQTFQVATFGHEVSATHLGITTDTGPSFRIISTLIAVRASQASSILAWIHRLARGLCVQEAFLCSSSKRCDTLVPDQTSASLV